MNFTKSNLPNRFYALSAIFIGAMYPPLRAKCRRYLPGMQNMQILYRTIEHPKSICYNELEKRGKQCIRTIRHFDTVLYYIATRAVCQLFFSKYLQNMASAACRRFFIVFLQFERIDRKAHFRGKTCRRPVPLFSAPALPHSFPQIASPFYGKLCIKTLANCILI